MTPSSGPGSFTNCDRHHHHSPVVAAGPAPVAGGEPTDFALIPTLARTGRAPLSAAAVAPWIGDAYWFTSSTSFTHPAVTIARMFSDTFAGINPTSVPMFILFRILDARLGAGLALFLYPAARTAADAVLVPHTQQPATDRGSRNHTAPAAETTTR